MAIGYIDKDFIEEGPFRLVFYDIQMDDPSILENVKLWFSDKKFLNTYYMGTGVEKTDSGGNVIYVFNGDTREARKLLANGSLATEKVLNDEAKYGISELSTQDGIATAVTSSYHVFSGGDIVEIEDASEYNGRWEVIDAPSSDEFRFLVESGKPTINPQNGSATLVEVSAAYSRLQPDRSFIAEISFTSTAFAELRATGARGEILVRPSGPIL